jgi:hypothetical protein
VQSLQASPQWVESELVSGLAQLPSGQGGVPFWSQAHCEPTQAPEAQVWPQPPQLDGSLVRSVSHWPSPLQSAVLSGHWLVQDAAFWPSGQGVTPSQQRHWHWLPWQVLVLLPVEFAQEKLGSWFEQPPQLLGSLVGSVAQAPLPSQSRLPLGQTVAAGGQLPQLGSSQAVWPSGQKHCWFEQVVPEPPQITPQPPQLYVSAVMS